jgi:hypothetical protein
MVHHTTSESNLEVALSGMTDEGAVYRTVTHAIRITIPGLSKVIFTLA